MRILVWSILSGRRSKKLARRSKRVLARRRSVMVVTRVLVAQVVAVRVRVILSRRARWSRIITVRAILFAIWGDRRG